MRTESEIAIELIKDSEGFDSKPYLCPNKVPTIGYGFTRYRNGSKVSLSDPPMSREDADAYLFEVVWSERGKVTALLPGISGPRLAALIDFTFNFGTEALRTSTLRKCILANDWAGACAQLRRWVHSGDPPKVLPGLVKRREREIKLIESTL